MSWAQVAKRYNELRDKNLEELAEIAGGLGAAQAILIEAIIKEEGI